MSAEVIAELTSAVQNFVLHGTRPAEGTMIEARQLAARWKSAGRSLFDSSTHDRSLLLGALVIALRRDHELLELIRQHRPEELDKLISESLDAETEAIASGWSTRQPILTARQRSERKRRKRNRTFSNSIEYQFGGGLEAQVDWRTLLLPLIGSTAYKDMLRRSQSCLDDIFAGQSVNTVRLEELFWMDRHRFAEPLRGIPKRSFNYVAATNIMDFLLKEKRRKQRKTSKRGRSPRLPWLYELGVRRRVLMGIKARINSLAVGSDIANAFLKVIRRHLRNTGKK